MTGLSKKWTIFVTVCFLQFDRIDGGPGDIELSTSFAFPVYNFYMWNKDNGHKKKYSDSVYWEHLEKAYRKNPDAIRNALIESRQRKYERRVVTDQYGRKLVWDPRFGFIPMVMGAYHQPDVKHIPITWKPTPSGPIAWRQTPSGPVALRQTPSGPIPISPNILPGFIPNQREFDFTKGDTPIWCDPRFEEYMKPVLSSDGPSMNPCRNKQQSEFGMTATSEMTDMLCSFCQVINHLRCVWQFCSHPEGVYKINLHERFKK